MKIVVIGATGLTGAKTVAVLHAGGHEVVAVSRKLGVDVFTGAGLDAAVAGAHAVIDLSDARSSDATAALTFFETAGRNLLAAEAAAGVRHHVVLSIVGADRVPDQRYYRAKVVQEKRVEESGIPYTIVRSTQFLEFLRGIADAHMDGDVVRLPPALLQPIAADDVAAIVAEVALATPRNGIVEIAGPERAPFDAIVARYLKSVGDRRSVMKDADARYFGGQLQQDSLVPSREARVGRIGLDAWLRGAHAHAHSPQRVEIRPVDRGDFDVWYPLWKGYQRFYDIDIPDAVTRATWARFMDPSEPMHAALAVAGEQVLGLVHWLYHRSTWTTDDYCYLQDLFVADDARGCGAGRALIEHVYADATRRSVPRVYWLTHKTNRQAMQLYDRVAERSDFVQYRKRFV
ncbi:GNAT family N-acetyltransferase [Burkholderia metallica]|uniref:GNAT family N-acetyltransferase n=1 Tax=Burkholderia metallica TaxID=488729 RepID=UPI001452DDF0|nr:GNAT family N-acetyltransferase [Burkholderia metallica]VWB41574.1 N-acetyltransferase GCN5 [Burkholderia metallica]